MKAIRTILASLRKADNTYNLINQGDKIVVGLSGGKDSVALIYALYLYQKFSHTDFIIQPVIMDLGFPGFNAKVMEEFCESLGLKLIISNNQEVYKILKIQQKDNIHLPCSICSRMKKAAINKVAKELGYNKVAFAHHIDDAVETLFMNEIYGGRMATFSPKMFLERAEISFIRPLLLVNEKDIKRLIKEENLPVLTSSCPADKKTKREEIKILLNEIYQTFPSAKENFVNMISNYEKEDLWGKEIYLHINQNGLSLKPVINKIDTLNMNNIRYQVFVKEMNVPFEDEFIIEEEIKAHSFLIYKDEIPLGTIRYREISDRHFKIERLTILKEYRKKGYAKEAVTFLSDYIGKAYNPCEITIYAMEYVKDLYIQCGFIVSGEPFDEVNIKHVPLKKVYR